MNPNRWPRTDTGTGPSICLILQQRHLEKLPRQGYIHHICNTNYENYFAHIQISTTRLGTGRVVVGRSVYAINMASYLLHNYAHPKVIIMIGLTL